MPDQILYIGVCHDRHCDPVVTAHHTREEAIQHARTYMQEHVDAEGSEETENGDYWRLDYEYVPDDAYVVLVTLKEVTS